MTIVDTLDGSMPAYQKTYKGDASPKMDLYDSASANQSPLLNGFTYEYDTAPRPGLNGTKSHHGPDQCSSAEAVWSTEPGKPVKLRMGSDPDTNGLLPESVPSWFKRIADANSAKAALKVKRDGHWKTWTYKEYYEEVQTAAKAFIHLGLEPYHAVGIIGFNSPEWFVSDMAAIHAGGIAVGIYTTNTAEASRHNAYDSKANIIVVDDDKQLQKILKIRGELPELKAIVQYTGKPAVGPEDNVYSWSEFLDLAKYVPDIALINRQRAMSPNRCCTLIYTSGTTGNPKGAMLSHDNLVWTSKMSLLTSVIAQSSVIPIEQEVFVSYLPLSHVAAQMNDIYLSYGAAGVVYFAQPDALKGTLVETLREARPTVLIGVPRVWEKMAEQIQSAMKKNGAVKGWISSVAQDLGLRGNFRKLNGQANGTPLGWSLANAMVFKRVRESLGLQRCRFTCSGAAPIMRETLEFFLSFNIPIYDIYGMSESSAPHCSNHPLAFKLGSSGKEISGVTTRIEKPNADGNGEICMFGRHVFMGYVGTEEKTREAIDNQGYLHTGDIGHFDREGFLFITGRLKEILITAGGENVPPIPIEDTIKEELPIVSYAMVIGDRRKFLSVLLTLKSEIDLKTGAPLNKLTNSARSWIKDNCGVELSTVTEAQNCAPLLKMVEKRIAEANKRAVSRAQNVQKFKILPEDFTIFGGELGPTLKVKRQFISKKYTELIEDFYSGAGES